MKLEKPFSKGIEDKIRRIAPSLSIEPRSIMLGYVLPGYSQGRRPSVIYRELSGLIDGGVMPSKNSIFAYFEKCLEKNGLVNEEYSLTRDGELASSASILALQTTERLGVSMQTLLGHAASNVPEQNAPFARCSILKSLYLNGKARVIDISRSIDLTQSSVTNHLESMKGLGFVNFISGHPEDDRWARYVWFRGQSPEFVEPYDDGLKSYPELTADIADLLHEIKEASGKEITRLLGYGHPTVVSSILAQLEREGFCYSWMKGVVRQSEASLTAKGRKFVGEFVLPFEEIVSGRRTNGLHTDGLDLAAASRLYASASIGAKRRSGSSRMEQILSFIGSCDRPPRYIEIERHLGIRPHAYLVKMEGAGKVRKLPKEECESRREARYGLAA